MLTTPQDFDAMFYAVLPTAAAIARTCCIISLNCAGVERLRAVAQRAIGIGMHFDDQAVGSRGHRGASHGQHLIAAAGSVRRIAHHGQMRKLLHHRNGRNVHGISRVRFERADAALAQDHFVISAAHDIFGGQQQFLDGGGLPRFSNTGLRSLPTSRSKLKFCILRAPTCKMSE